MCCHQTGGHWPPDAWTRRGAWSYTDYIYSNCYDAGVAVCCAGDARCCILVTSLAQMTNDEIIPTIYQYPASLAITRSWQHGDAEMVRW